MVIVNPTKFENLPAVRRRIDRVADDVGFPAPQWVETTAQDPGFGQTRAALQAGARLVCVLGGDGTVRAVAEVLAGSGVPLGLLPGGTGNLLARNVGAPVARLETAMITALTGRNRAIDIGWMIIDPTQEQRAHPHPAELRDDPNVHAFTVMAGLGFDAQIMVDAPEEVKAKVGWAAYVVSASKHLRDAPFQARIELDGRVGKTRGTRTVVVGNCGRLTGGMVLLPEAAVDDGVLDVARVSPRTLAQWATMATRVLSRRHDGGPHLTRRRGREVVVRVQPTQLVQVDGDDLVTASVLRFVVDPGALVVRS